MTALRPPSPVVVKGLFQPDREALLDLLASLDRKDWNRPTACPGWSIKDVALHVLGGDLGNIAGRRDGIWGLSPRKGEAFPAFINRMNHEWVDAARRFSPRLIVEMLRWSGPHLFRYLESLDPMSVGAPVSWAGPDPAPVWLDVAREYTERWVHQQHIRDATGRPGQTEERFLAPVIATFMHALPPALTGADAPVGAVVAVKVEGEAGGEWAVVRESSTPGMGRWSLWQGRSAGAEIAEVQTDVDTAWRLLTLGMEEEEVRRRVRLDGDVEVAAQLLRAVAIIA